MSVRRTRWLALPVVAVAIAAVSLAAAAPAAAHGANGQPIPDAAHYLSQITAISPAVPGLTAGVDPRGEWIEVTNATGRTLTVLGYAREPYLRVDASGVSQNAYSPTLTLNQSLFGDLSQLGDSTLPPSWEHIASGSVVRWHDHRIHWMGADRPPAVKQSPGQAHLVGDWTVHLMLAGTPVDVRGTLNWLPIKSHTSRFLLYFLVVDSAAFAVVVAIVTWLMWRRRRAAPGTPAGPGVSAGTAWTSAGTGSAS